MGYGSAFVSRSHSHRATPRPVCLIQSPSFTVVDTTAHKRRIPASTGFDSTSVATTSVTWIRLLHRESRLSLHHLASVHRLPTSTQTQALKALVLLYDAVRENPWVN